MLRGRPPRMRALTAPRTAPRNTSLTTLIACAIALLGGFGEPSARAQDRELPRLVEGAPDASVVLDGVEAARQRLTDGDKAWQDGQREVAFDAWREAIVASTRDAGRFADGVVVDPPLGSSADTDGTLSRRAEDCTWSVRRRLAALGVAERADWRARFEPLAEIERTAAGTVDERLARVQREFPHTRAAALAALALADRAAERGDRHDARAWCARASTDAPSTDASSRDGSSRDDALLAAIARRIAAAERVAVPERVAAAERAATTKQAAIPPADADAALRALVVRKRVAFGAAIDARDATIPGLAFQHADASDPASVAVWLHTNGRLLRFDADGNATAALDVDAVLRDARVATVPTFSEPGGAWDERFALADDAIALVLGRARLDSGNALVGVEPSESPHVLWIRDSRGLVLGGERVESAPLAEPEALLDFQPGPLRVGDVLVVHVRAWSPGTEGAGRTEVDEAHTESWCAGLDPRTGARKWSRRLATGSTWRGLGRGRLDAAESTSWPALPPAAGPDGQVSIDTGLGAIALVDALDGRLAWTLRTARQGDSSAPAGGLVATSPPAGGTAGSMFWCAPASGTGALLRLAGGADRDGAGILRAQPCVLDEPRIPVDARGERWLAWAPAVRGVQLVRQDLRTGESARSAVLPFVRLERGTVAAAPLGSSWIVSAGGHGWVIDADLRLVAELDGGPGTEFARTAIAADSRQGADGAGRVRVCIAGPNVLVFAANP